MSYIDGFVAAVPTANREAYKAYAEKALVAFKEYGASGMVECWGDDVPQGKVTSFPMAVQVKDDETVVFSWIMWPSKEVRDAGHAQMMNDPRFDPKTNPMPFDGKRMIYGGFVPILQF
jgi:uncharacterized protein YbaA (DUF1428 family)